MAHGLMNTIRIYEDTFQSLASLYGLRIQRCHGLWQRLQMWLRPYIAVAVVQASSCSSDSTPDLGTSLGAALKRKKKKFQFSDTHTLIYLYTYESSALGQAFFQNLIISKSKELGSFIKHSHCFQSSSSNPPFCFSNKSMHIPKSNCSKKLFFFRDSQKSDIAI